MNGKSTLGLTLHEWTGVILGALVLVPVALTISRHSASADTYAGTATTTGIWQQQTASSTTNTALTLPTLYTVPGACGSGKILVKWTSVVGVLDYKLRRDGEGVYVGDKQMFEDKNLAPGSRHEYALVAHLLGLTLSPVTTAAYAPPLCETQDEDDEEDTDASNTATSTTEVADAEEDEEDVVTTTVTALLGPLPIIPGSTHVYVGQEQKFSVPESVRTGKVYWKILEGTKGGVITSDGLYKAPSQAGTYHVLATIPGSSYKEGVATVNVTLRTAVAPTIVDTGTVVASTTTVRPVPKPTTVTEPAKSIVAEIVTTAPKQEAEVQPRPALAPTEGKSIERAVADVPEEKKNEPLPPAVRIEAERIRIVADLLDEKEAARIRARLKLEEALAANPSARDKALALFDERSDDAEEDVDTLVKDITDEFEEGAEETDGAHVDKVQEALRILSDELRAKKLALQDQGADLLYTDSNGDGISDYESERVYGIDPYAPAPLSEYEGRKISAAEKILLGFDPAKEELVPVVPEEPTSAEVEAATSYKVEDVALTGEKKVALSGRALPNSFITLFIYSTPIIVTVQTDADGEWEYTLDKELDDGSHTVYTATVSNSGKILARSQGYLFTKTAEAATLESVIPEAVAVSEEPRLLETGNMWLIIGAIVLLLIIGLGVLGYRSRAVPPPPAI